MKRMHALGLLLVAAVGCGGATVREVRGGPGRELGREAAPARGRLTIPEPQTGSSPRVERSSTLRVTLRLPLAAIARAADTAGPTVLAEESGGGRFPTPAYRYRVTRGPIGVSGAGTRLEWSVPVHLEGSAELIGGCTADLTARVATRVGVTPEWQLAASSSRGPVSWERRCRLLGLIDLTSAIEPRVREAQDAMARAIDEGLASRDLRAAVGRAWTELAGRIALSDEAGLWLRPSALRLSALEASPTSIEATLELAVRPVVALEAPVGAAPPPLPVGAEAERRGGDFTLFVDVLVPLARVAAELGGPARAQLASLGGELRAVRAIGGRDAIYVGFELARPEPVTAWFAAQVAVNAARGTLDVTNVRATAETRAVMASVGVDVGVVERAFRFGLSFPVDEQVEAIAVRYRAAMASPRRLDGGAELTVEPGSVELVDTFHTPTEIGFVLAVSGSAELLLAMP